MHDSLAKLRPYTKRENVSQMPIGGVLCFGGTAKGIRLRGASDAEIGSSGRTAHKIVGFIFPMCEPSSSLAVTASVNRRFDNRHNAIEPVCAFGRIIKINAPEERSGDIIVEIGGRWRRTKTRYIMRRTEP